jgi:MOSC domain-containing protein YiiM
MRVISTNIGKPTSVVKNGKEIKTGIYKTSVKGPITLKKTGVVGDSVMDLKHHGGLDKACYLYSADHYVYWKEKFPDLYWTWGMFGENLTIEGLNEAKINIGDTFSIGTAIIQVSEPRRPCSVLGIRFGTHHMIKLFNNSTYPGVYVRILKEGEVKINDILSIVESYNSPSIAEIFSLFSDDRKNITLAKKAVSTKYLADSCIQSIKNKFNIK